MKHDEQDEETCAWTAFLILKTLQIQSRINTMKHDEQDEETFAWPSFLILQILQILKILLRNIDCA